MTLPNLCPPHQGRYGGRTGAVGLRYTAGLEESVRYVDVISLYPNINCALPHPLGLHVIVYRDFESPENYFGLIRAMVHPHRKLYFPVLPYTFAENNLQGDVMGGWVTPEFVMIEMGYRLGKIMEEWHFGKQSDSVFVQYMHMFLKGKQEDLGYPPEAMDQESQEKDIRLIRAFCWRLKNLSE